MPELMLPIRNRGVLVKILVRGRCDSPMTTRDNEVIPRAAFRAGVPVIDLRLVCTESSDYSPPSPIGPSVTGGAKIARSIAEVIGQHDFSRPRTVVYV